MPVHDVHMDHAGAARCGPLYLIRQVSEVRREYRGCELNRMLGQTGSRLALGLEAVEILARRRWLDRSCGNGRPRPFMPGESPATVCRFKSLRATQQFARYAPNCENRVSSEAASAFRALSTSSAIANFSFSTPSPVTAEIG